jgi:hypothetical protein
MAKPCERCVATKATCYRKARGPGCWGCSQRKVRCSAVTEREREAGGSGGGEGLAPPGKVELDEEVVGLLRRLVEGVEKGVEEIRRSVEVMERLERRIQVGRPEEGPVEGPVEGPEETETESEEEGTEEMEVDREVVEREVETEKETEKTGEVAE